MMTYLKKVTEPRAVLLALLALMVAGCASQPPVPQDRFYRLQAVFAAAPAAAPTLPGVLEITRFTADGLTAGRPIVFVEKDDPNQLREYHYHFWTQPPTIMLRDELSTYLRAANIAGQIVTPEMRLNPDFVMTGRIRALEQVLGQPNETTMEVEIAIRRIRDNQLVFLKTYRQGSIQNAAGVSAAVDALNQSMNVVFSDILADLKAL